MLKYTNFIGYGIVGKSCHLAFEHNTEAVIIDPAYNDNTIQNVFINKAALTFVSVGAPTLDSGKVDASSIYSIFQQLVDAEYKGIVVLKSTLPPDIVDDLSIKYGNKTIYNGSIKDVSSKHSKLRYVYSPEFIRESSWETDAISPSHIIMAGEYHDCDELGELYRNHSHITKYCTYHITDYKTASLIKYSINAYLATKVVFMNQMYQLYHDVHGGTPDTMHSSGWDEFSDILSADARIGDSHLNVPGPDGNYGYGGSCFPKDVKALIGFDEKSRLSVIREAEEVNTKIRLMGTKI